MLIQSFELGQNIYWDALIFIDRNRHGLYWLFHQYSRYLISSYSFLLSPRWGNYSSFYYIREKLMRKFFEIFKVLQFQKRIVAAATIWGNTVVRILVHSHFDLFSLLLALEAIESVSELVTQRAATILYLISLLPYIGQTPKLLFL